MENLRIDRSDRGVWTVVEVAGDLDVYTAPRLREFITRRIEEGRHLLILDLSGVGFLDSTGLAVIVAGLKRAKESEGDLVIVGPNEQIRRILNVTDLAKILPVHSDVEEVLAGH